MKFLVMIHTDDALVEALPEGEFDRLMNGCFAKADELRAAGKLLDSQQLEHGSTARTLRQRNGTLAITDGPFAEAKEVFAGFNLIEAADMDEALQIAQLLPWARTGHIEVRPVRDMEAVRRRVGA
ncbi:YciI family protein [Marilutibacter alkalisoli]|uniref:YciI family protein n=1 Tax=Marilutibacter alkalisoli TaxID=2591633 RepID=A0A514BNK8_9GAMM|nr:YciI family protein [Lysobacter alkalisoli]QDH68974.1 YciI family protein [Lysobacter alkalisoli]